MIAKWHAKIGSGSGAVVYDCKFWYKPTVVQGHARGDPTPKLLSFKLVSFWPDVPESSKELEADAIADSRPKLQAEQPYDNGLS